MPISFIVNDELSQLIPLRSVKFRENSADSVTFNMDGHGADEPRTVTISRSLPTPRKGNQGTVKTFINVRKTVIINEDTANEKPVVAILKIETSVPVGCSDSAIMDMFKSILDGLTTTGEYSEPGRIRSMSNLFIKGLLPNRSGDPMDG